MNALRVVFSVDVEEEGLFSGRFARTAQGVRNVASLERLAFVTGDFGVPLTLLATWPVLEDTACAALLRRWQDDRGAELGLHLHHWNTPPLAGEDAGYTPAGNLSAELLDAKLAALKNSLLLAGGRAAASFRMGRFDFAPALRALLPRHGLRVDSSFVPLRFVPDMPEAFLSPADPHPLPGTGGAVTEVPLTMRPLLPGAPRLAVAAARLVPGALGQGLLSSFRKVAAVGTQPAWYALPAMQMAARLHLARGGRVIHMFLHSSELAPGFVPHLPDEAAVERLLGRIRSFLAWLAERTPYRGARLDELAAEALQ